MADYININGNNIPIRASDPSNPIQGEIWYNSTTNLLKGQGAVSADAWSTGGNLPTGYQGGAGFGIQTAAVLAGGTPSPAYNLKTFEYNGSTWTAGNDMTRASGPPFTSAYSSGSGIQTAGWAAGGGYPTPNALTENYDGTSWTASAAMPSNRRGGNSSGPQTAGLFFAGFDGSSPQSSTFLYDGEAWTGGPSLSTARTNAGGSGPTGSQTAALSFAGNTPGFTSATEEYDGTSWTSGGSYPAGTSYVAYFGPSTNCYGCTGYAGGSALTSTNFYNGTSWAVSPASMSTGRLNYHNNAGTDSSGLVFGGEGPLTQTEEFIAAGAPVTQTISSS
jgi:hypothetical protein